jgi:hypothetical protein
MYKQLADMSNSHGALLQEVAQLRRQLASAGLARQ